MQLHMIKNGLTETYGRPSATVSKMNQAGKITNLFLTVKGELYSRASSKYVSDAKEEAARQALVTLRAQAL